MPPHLQLASFTMDSKLLFPGPSVYPHIFKFVAAYLEWCIFQQGADLDPVLSEKSDLDLVLFQQQYLFYLN